jgi:hypothetical protein
MGLDDSDLRHVAQDRDPWWAVVNRVMKVWVSQNEEI